MLQPDLRQFIPEDSLDVYYTRYANLLAEYYDGNATQMTIFQQSTYNYRMQQQKRVEAETRTNRLWMLVGWLLFVITALGGGNIYFKSKAKNRELRLYHALDVVNRLSAKINQASNKALSNSIGTYTVNGEDDYAEPVSFDVTKIPTEEELRAKLQKKLQNLLNTHSTPTLDSRIITSNAYRIFVESAKENSIVREDTNLWEELEKVVLEVSPDFKNRLKILAQGKLKPQEYQTALLIRCGFISAQIARIVGRQRSSIKNRVDILSEKFFDVRLETKTFNAFIQML